MGRGDKRTRRGKIFKSSYGNVRKHAGRKVARRTGASTAAAKKTAVSKKSK